MFKRLLYPGQFEPGTVLLITGAINTMYIVDAAKSLLDGTASKGHTCKVFMPGIPRTCIDWAATGDINTFEYSADLNIVIGGEYLGGKFFRQGEIPLSHIDRTVFFTSAATPELCNVDRMPWEIERIHAIQNRLMNTLGMPVSLAGLNLLRPTVSGQKLIEVSAEIVGYLAKGLEIPNNLLEKSSLLTESCSIDQVPALDRPLW